MSPYDRKFKITFANQPAETKPYIAGLYDKIHTPTVPMRIVGGGGASVGAGGGQGADSPLVIMGLLVDPEDLYAATIPTTLDNPKIEQGHLVADVLFSSPRPRIVAVATSEDLSTFDTDATADLVESESPSIAAVTVPADSSSKFITVTATSRPK